MPKQVIDLKKGTCYDTRQIWVRIGPMDTRQRTGHHGEEIAASFLAARGYHIIERNWRCSSGELDLVATDGNVLVFVEVRTRSGLRFGLAEESITLTKQTRLIALAETYLQEKSLSTRSWRIDVVAVQLGPGLPQVKHIENAVGWS
jgi:putative endonuclease